MPSVDLALASVKYGKANNVPVILDIRDLYPDVIVEAAPKSVKPFAHLATQYMKSKVAEICRDATAIWGNSDAFVEWGCRLGGRVRSKQDLTLPIAYKPLEIDQQETANIQQKWKVDGLFRPEHLNIVFFGTLSKAFDFGPVIEVAKQLSIAESNHRFHIFGAGQQENYIADRCASLGNCTFHGPVGAATLQAAMDLSDIGLAPYIFTDNFAANMPNKTTEYLGGGLMVGLAFKTGVLAEFLKKTGSGFFYESAAELFQILTELERSPERVQIGRQSASAAFEANLGYDTLSELMHNKIKTIVETNNVLVGS
jgi:glycosyltransferase involved in cell wall biosynthesis